MSILQGDFANEVAEALESAEVPFDLTLSRDVAQDSPAPEPGDPPIIVTVNYPCRGFIDQYDASWRAGSLIEAGDVKIIIVANTLSVEPVAGDLITARGKVYAAISVQADPAVATYQIQGRT